MRRTSQLARSPMPARTASLQRGGRLKPRSDKMKASKVAQRAVYAGMAQQAEAKCCYACGTTRHIEHSHCLTQGRHKLQRANPLNILYLCGELANGCHAQWENHKAEFARRYPHAYAEKVRRMLLIDPAAARFFLSKNPAPATTY